MDHRVWTQPQADTICTLMSRLYSWWPDVKCVAKLEPGNVKIDWSADGSHLLFSWSYIQARKITLSQLKHEIIREAQELKLVLGNIVPGVDLSTFDSSNVVDDPASPVSLFDRPENKAIFEPYIQQLRQALKQGPHNTGGTSSSFVYNTTGRIMKKRAQTLLARSEVFLGKALVHFCKTIGVPPRAWQIGEFLYRAAGQYDRNTRLLNNRIAYIGNPKAKQKDKLVYDSFWALVPHLGSILMVYLGAYRPVEIEIMQDLNIPTAEHTHYIFVHMTMQKTLSSYAYSPTKVNSLLKGVEDSVIPYEARALRHIFTAIIEQHFPPPHKPADKGSAVVSQGQHELNTKEGWYARDQIQRSTGLSVSSRNRQLAIGQSLQAWVGFVPANYEYSYYGDRPNIGIIEENRQYAFNLARSLILQGDYCVADGDQSTRKSRVMQLMTLKPFLTGWQQVRGFLQS
jgi:hypothetical protein